MTSVRCHRSEQLNVQHTDMSANTVTNATNSSQYVVASQLGERTGTTRRRYSSPSVPLQNTSATLYSVTILNQNPGHRATALDHHVYDQLSKMWLRRSSEPQPCVMLTVTPVREDYADLRFPLKSKTRSSILRTMADTGCQSCLGGMRRIPRLGMTVDDLIPVSMKMHAANGNGINIVGAAILRFSCKSPYGEPRETRQITYITDNSDKLVLSREACISLGMITARFPTVAEAMSPSCPQLSCAGSTDETDIDTHRCGCPRRQKPPPVPTKLPYAAHGENRSKLQEYLLDYSSSTFNTC